MRVSILRGCFLTILYMIANKPPHGKPLSKRQIFLLVGSDMMPLKKTWLYMLKQGLVKCVAVPDKKGEFYVANMDHGFCQFVLEVRIKMICDVMLKEDK